MKKRGGLVYSTGKGRISPGCGWPADRCVCSHNLKDPAGAAPRGDGVVRVSRQTKGRKGKGVTVVTGVPLAASELASLATELKKKCGSGGSLRDGLHVAVHDAGLVGREPRWHDAGITVSWVLWHDRWPWYV